MQPVLAVRQVNYRDCGCRDHHHRHQRTALACITRRQRRDGATASRWSPAVLAALLAEIRGGGSRQAAAQRLGISVSYLGDLLQRALTEEQLHHRGLEAALDQLSPGSRAALARAGLASPQAVRDALADDSLRYVPGLGAQRLLELQRWLAEIGN